MQGAALADHPAGAVKKGDPWGPVEGPEGLAVWNGGKVAYGQAPYPPAEKKEGEEGAGRAREESGLSELAGAPAMMREIRPDRTGALGGFSVERRGRRLGHRTVQEPHKTAYRGA